MPKMHREKLKSIKWIEPQNTEDRSLHKLKTIERQECGSIAASIDRSNMAIDHSVDQSSKGDDRAPPILPEASKYLQTSDVDI